MSFQTIRKFSVKKICEKFKNDETFNYYFSDFSDNQKPEKEYLLALLGKLKSNSVKLMIKEFHKNREKEDAIEKGEVIQITRQLLSETKSAHFRYSKFRLLIVFDSKDKGIYLLKQSTKLEFQRKRPRRFGISDQDESSEEERKE